MGTDSIRVNGMKELRRIGISWFVSYAYYDHIDRSHNKWNNTTTIALRKSCYERTRQFHAEWIHHVLDADPTRLARNTLGLSSDEVQKMAKKLLDYFD